MEAQHLTSTEHTPAGYHATCTCGWTGSNHPEPARETRQGESTRRFSYNPSREARLDAADHAKKEGA